jgi:hypothetical protein
MKLLANPDNWTGQHAERAIAAAHRAFAQYEAKVDFSKPIAEQNALYLPYQIAREDAVIVANYTNWKRADANRLP